MAFTTWGLPSSSSVDAALLITTELVANTIVHAPATTVTDTDGVNALPAQTETTGGGLRIRRHTPAPRPEPATVGQAPEGDPLP